MKKENKLLVLTIIICVLFSMATVPDATLFVPTYVSADFEEVWDGSVAEGFESGSGTKESPYIIKTASQLAYFSKSVNRGTSYYKKYIKLSNDIVLNTPDVFAYDKNGNITGAADGKAPNEWTAISHFGGTFDGDNHEIKGIYINKPNAWDCQGLFGYCSMATVKNVGVVDGYIHANIEVGGLAGYFSGTIEGCYNTCVVKGGSSVGGILGCTMSDFQTNVINCYNMGNVNGQINVGGIVGNIELMAYEDYRSATVEGCYNTGNVTGNSGVGGIVGDNRADTNYESLENGYDARSGIACCYNTGVITGSSVIGGIVGGNYASGDLSSISVSSCYNAGVITGGNHIGGIVGENHASGDLSSISVSSCYNAGLITGSDCIGGIVGENTFHASLQCSGSSLYIWML